MKTTNDNKTSDFKNIRFTDGTNEIPYKIAKENDFFKSAYGIAKTIYCQCIDDINDHNATLVLNNSEKYEIVNIENVSSELEQILIQKGAWK